MTNISVNDLNLEGIKTVVFDLDGTLYDNKHIALHLIFSDLRHARLMGSERNARRLLKGLDFGNPDAFYHSLFNHMVARQNVSYMYARDWYFGSYLPLMVKVLKKYYKVAPFVVPLVKDLHERGIKIAVFSDYRCVDEKLEAIGLDPSIFDFRIAAPDIGGLKPNKNLFERLLSLIDAQADTTLMIGDRDDTDREGAKRVGMHFYKV